MLILQFENFRTICGWKNINVWKSSKIDISLNQNENFLNLMLILKLTYNVHWNFHVAKIHPYHLMLCKIKIAMMLHKHYILVLKIRGNTNHILFRNSSINKFFWCLATGANPDDLPKSAEIAIIFSSLLARSRIALKIGSILDHNLNLSLEIVIHKSIRFNLFIK